MYSDTVVVFNYLISQWSLTPAAFKEAVLAAALVKCVLAVIWWTTRVVVAAYIVPSLGSTATLPVSMEYGVSRSASS